MVEIYSALTLGAVARIRPTVERVYLELMIRGRFGNVGHERRTRDRRLRHQDEGCSTQPAPKNSH